LAKVLGVSQPTVSRIRSKLVKDGFVKEFTIIPDFVKMGFEILAITSGKYRVVRSKDVVEKGQKWVNKNPCIIFASQCQGGGKDGLLISIHRDYADYTRFLNDLGKEMGGLIENTENLLINLKGFIAKPLSLSYITKLFEE